MKRLQLLLACVCALAVSQQSGAVLFFQDQFNYADGDLTDYEQTQGGSSFGDNVSGGLWNDHGGGGFLPRIDVQGGAAVVKTSGSEDANRSAGVVQPLDSTWYYAAKVTVNDLRSDTNDALNNDYFMHFYEDNFQYRTRAYVADPNANDPTKFTFGLSATSGGQVSQFGTDFDFGTQYLIVGSYDNATGTSNLWVNPVDESSPSITDTDIGAAFVQTQGLALRQDFFSNVDSYEVLVDAVALGDTFHDVVAGACIPEPSTILLSVLGGVGLLVARRKMA